MTSGGGEVSWWAADTFASSAHQLR
jgi:hypothetical protein